VPKYVDAAEQNALNSTSKRL